MVHLLLDAAALNGALRGRIIQIDEFGDDARRRHIRRTPTVVAHGTQLSGNVPAATLAAFLWHASFTASPS
ncbi:MAG: hypothetical protein OWU84_07980 [Firmicutes bacterium]|nr:hypothetical protein [Bacillota bacterium]